MLAKLHGWLVMHTRAVEIRPGVWKTPLTGHPGYPDLTLVHSTRGVIFAELKAVSANYPPAKKYGLASCPKPAWKYTYGGPKTLNSYQND